MLKVKLALCVTLPPVAVTVTVEFPMLAVPVCTVNVVEPLPPGTGFGAKLALAPLGKPLTLIVTPVLNQFVGAIAYGAAPVLFVAILSTPPVGPPVNVKPCCAAIVSVKVAVFVTLPPVAVTVTVELPTPAVPA